MTYIIILLFISIGFTITECHTSLFGSHHNKPRGLEINAGQESILCSDDGCQHIPKYVLHHRDEYNCYQESLKITFTVTTISNKTINTYAYLHQERNSCLTTTKSKAGTICQKIKRYKNVKFSGQIVKILI